MWRDSLISHHSISIKSIQKRYNKKFNFLSCYVLSPSHGAVYSRLKFSLFFFLHHLRKVEETRSKTEDYKASRRKKSNKVDSSKLRLYKNHLSTSTVVF